MQMMYDIVARELKSMQLADSTPQDYLNFYCLGNREQNFDKNSNADAAMVITSTLTMLYLILKSN